MIGVKRFAGFEDTVAQMKQFTHGGDVNGHLLFAALGQPFFESSNYWVPFVRRQCRHEQHRSKMAVAPLDDMARTLYRGAGITLAGRQAGECGQLLRLCKAGDIGNFSKENSRRCIADTGDCLQEFLVALEMWILVDVVLDALLQCIDLSINEGNMGIDGFQYLLVLEARLAPIPLPLPVSLQCHNMAYHRPQLEAGRRSWRPEVGLMLGAVVGDGAGIFAIRLVPLHQNFSMALDPLGINNAHVVSPIVKEEGQLHPIAATGLHAGVHRFGRALLEPTRQLPKAALVVAEMTTPGLLIAEQGDVKTLFGDVYTEGKLGHVTTYLIVDGKSLLQDNLVNGCSLPLQFEGHKISLVLGQT